MPCLVCEGIKAQWFLCPSSEAQIELLFCYFVTAPRCTSAGKECGLTGGGRVAAVEGLSVPAQVVQVWMPEWLLRETGEFPNTAQRALLAGAAVLFRVQ